MVKPRSVVATSWSAADTVVRQALQLAATIWLSRLIAPEEFGVIAVLYLFLAMATVMAEAGLGTALIQRQGVTASDESTVFWLNAFLGLLLAFAVFAGAPLIAAFFNEPILAEVGALMSLNVVFGALSTVHIAKLTKELNFRLLTVVGASGTALSGVIAVAMAAHGLGVWALATQSVVLTGSSCILLWILNPWRPRLEFRRESARKFFNFGGYMLASGLLEAAFSRAYAMVLGRFHSMRDVGHYMRAENTQHIPSSLLSQVVARVAFPLFSESAGQPQRLKAGMRIAIQTTMLLNAPMMLGAAALAGPLISTLFGDAWTPAVPVFQVLCLAGVLLPLQVVNLNVLLAQGHARLMFRLEIIKKGLGLAFLGAGGLYGLLGVAWGYALFAVVAFLINSHFTRTILAYGPVRQMRDVSPSLGAATMMAAVIYLVEINWTAEPVLELGALAPLGAGVYAAIARGTRSEALTRVTTALRPGNQRA